jgi:hypothetical protein
MLQSLLAMNLEHFTLEMLRKDFVFKSLPRNRSKAGFARRQATVSSVKCCKSRNLYEVLKHSDMYTGRDGVDTVPTGVSMCRRWTTALLHRRSGCRVKLALWVLTLPAGGRI